MQIAAGPRLISKLLVRYLLKRRIAWVSLAAVMLCTAMVLVVISVMGGWLRMFRETNHALIGDLAVQRVSQDGFSHYQEMIDQINALPEVKAATPVVQLLCPGANWSCLGKQQQNPGCGARDGNRHPRSFTK